MNEDNKELVEYLDKKFSKIDDNFDRVDRKFETLSDIFITKDDLESFRDEYKKDFNNLLTAVDAYATKAEAFFQELVMLSHKVDRHEKWLLQIADKLGIKLQY